MHKVHRVVQWRGKILKIETWIKTLWRKTLDMIKHGENACQSLSLQAKQIFHICIMKLDAEDGLCTILQNLWLHLLLRRELSSHCALKEDYQVGIRLNVSYLITIKADKGLTNKEITTGTRPDNHLSLNQSRRQWVLIFSSDIVTAPTQINNQTIMK